MDELTKRDWAESTEAEQKAAKSPLMSLLEWQQKALTGLDADISDLIHKLEPVLEPEPLADINTEQTIPKDTHGSEFAKQFQGNTEKIERLSNHIKSIIRRCDV